MKSRLAAIAVAVAVAGAAVVLGIVYWHRPPAGLPAAESTAAPADAKAVLNAYFRQEQSQRERLAAYSDSTTIRASLPGVSKSGEMKVQRHFTAPRRLTFTSAQYSGDGFVKHDIILGFLSHEATHVHKGDGARTAIAPANYRFSYQGRQELLGVPVLVFAVQPRRIMEGMFAGRIYLNASSGGLVRAEGRFVKSPSMFVDSVRFVKDYREFHGFDLPVHIHSDSDSQMAGHVVMDIYHQGYQVTPSS